MQDATTGKIVSAKNPRKWDRMFNCRAAFVEPPSERNPRPTVRLTLPDGSQVTSDQAGVDARLSALFGREVRVVASRPTRRRWRNTGRISRVWLIATT